MAIWFLIFPVAWIVVAFITGEELWRLGVAPILWLIVPWLVTRVMRFQTIILDAKTIRRVGFFKDVHMAWSDITGIRHFEQQYGKRGMAFSLALGYFLLGDQRRRYGQSLLRGVDSAPYEKKLKYSKHAISLALAQVCRPPEAQAAPK